MGTKVAPQDPMTDEQVIMELRRRSRHRGHQIVGYRRKLMQQVKKKRGLTVYSFYHVPNNYGNLIILRSCDYLFLQTAEMNKVRSDHKKQLDDIASQLILFEASLTSRQKTLADTLSHKDQVRS